MRKSSSVSGAEATEAPGSASTLEPPAKGRAQRVRVEPEGCAESHAASSYGLGKLFVLFAALQSLACFSPTHVFIWCQQPLRMDAKWPWAVTPLIDKASHQGGRRSSLAATSQ